MHTVTVLTLVRAELQIASVELPREVCLAGVLAYTEVFTGRGEVLRLQGREPEYKLGTRSAILRAAF